MLNNYIIPVVVLIIICYGFFKKVNIYENFIDGALDGIKIVLEIIPTIFAMIVAVNVFVNSNVLQIIKGVNSDILTMVFLRPISGNATLACLSNIYSVYGVDSFISYLASVIQGSTDTTIYVLALYFSSIRVKKTRYALPAGLFADFCGITAAFIVVHFFF